MIGNIPTRNASFWLAGFIALGLALVPAAQARQETQTPIDAAYDNASKAMVNGPADIKVLSQAELKLPEGFAYVPKAESIKLLEAMGNGIDNEVEGMIFPTTGEGQNWFMVVSFENSGYIKDDDAKEWDPADLLESIKAGTEEANKERVKMGIPEMEVRGWAEIPRYDVSTHQLVWSLKSVDKGAADESAAGVNYNTILLGREGKISMNLVADLQSLESLKPMANNMLSQLTFVPGKAYSDFNESTDRVAEYGLAALVAGAAAKKLGLLGVIGLFLAKFGKFILIGLVGVGAVLRSFFSGRKKADQ